MWHSFRSRSGQTKRSIRRHAKLGVELLEDRLAPATFTVLNTSDSGVDSFRQAILNANAAPGADTINFHIGGGGVQTIAPTSILPQINDAVTIDATTQPGFAGTPIIELNGASAGAFAGLWITAGNSTVRGLVINRFNGYGILLRTNGNNVITGNYIGTDVSGTVARGNVDTGIRIESSAANTIGGVTAADRNVVSGNGIHGIVMFGAGTTDTVVQGNYIGANAAGTSALGNGNTGVVNDRSAHNNRIGTDGDGANDAAEGNLISGNRVHGVFLNGVGADDNVLAGNKIGTDVTGTLDLGNGVDGVRINNGANNTIGGTSAAARNVISGNGVFGVFIFNPSATGNVVTGNHLGTDVAGTAALANGQAGVAIQHGAHDNRVGTLGTEADTTFVRNLISGNGTFGVTFDDGGNNNVVRGNYIGTDATGMAALGNGDAGVMMSNSANNTIGGTTAAARNVVAANGGSGVPNAAHGIVMFLAGATGNIVQGNYVGTNAVGTAPLGNVGGGVILNGGAHHNLVGTDGDGVNDAAEGNLISGGAEHEGAGVILAATGTDHNLVAGNRIGTDVTGTLALANNTGVLFYPGPQSNQIGGSPALTNTIAFNRYSGVVLLSGGTTLNNRIQANSIHSNGFMGIDLGNNGFTLNDTLDADAGPNALQNFPVIISTTPGAATTIFGRFHSRPNTTYTLDFYANAVADPTGFGEGQRYLGAATVTTDANGDMHYFTVTLPGASVAGEVISATATDPDGNTSEFSGNRAPTASAGGPYAISEGQGVALDASGSSDPDFDALTYSWDINGDGVFGDATGMQPTLTWAQLNALGINDGLQSHPVRVRVDDDAGHVVISPATTLTVTNVVPTVVLAGPIDGVRGQTRTFTLSASDPSSVDESAGFVYSINWGDGSPQQTVGRTPGNGSGVAVDHDFAEAGTYTVVATASDKDDGVSAAASLTIEITVLAFQADPCDSTKTALVIGGTSGDDHIVFNPGSGPGAVQVIFNGVSLGTYSPTGAIIAYGQEGNDDIQVAGSLTQTAWLYGDAGNDRLFGGGGPSILLGGVGDDQLLGGSDRDLMIGGLGADHLVGNGNDDILIGGYTSFDGNQEALCALLDEWTASRDYATRVANLKGTGSGPRANGDYFLKANGADRTVFDDAAADRMVGSSGKDWIFANLDSGVLDDVSGLLQTELVEEVAG